MHLNVTNLRKAGSILLAFLSVLIGFLGILFFLSQRWMLKTWAHLTVEELLYQMAAPLQGTSSDILWDYAFSCAFPALAVLLVLIALLLLFRSITKIRVTVLLLALFAGIGFTVFSVQNVYKSLDVEEYVESQATVSNFIEENYVDPAVISITFPEKKRNLIYLFLESMECTYSSKEHGGGMEENYIPRLTALAEEDGTVNFSNTDQLGGALTTVSTTFTAGGLFAQTSGLPLKVSVTQTDLAYQENFFPSITCLGDILEENGYRNFFLMGSDGAFGGRSNYFTQHGNFEILDYYWALSEDKIPENYYEWWGFEDQKLFAYAKEKLTELAADEEPFCFMLLTVDTHFEDGYVCPACPNTFDSQYGNVIYCSDTMICDLVQWIREQTWYNNTTVVLSGDHLTMDSDFCNSVDSDYTQTVYNCILNSAVEPVKEKNRTFTTLDLFPTTLAAMGCTIEGDRLGLGTNLFSESDTLTEELSFRVLNRKLRENSDFFESREIALDSQWEDSRYYLAEEDRYAVDEWITWNPHQLWADGDQLYYIDEEGNWVSGWVEIGGYWYYFGENSGTLQKGPLLQPDE